MASTDWFSQIYSALWEAILDDSVLAAKVKIGNRVRFDGTDPNPVKESLTPDAVPELALIERSVAFNTESEIGASSNSEGMTCRYDVVVTTEHLLSNHDEGINFIKCRLVRIFATARPSLLSLVLFDDVDGVTEIGRVCNLNYGDLIQTTDDPLAEFTDRRGRGWKCVFSVRVSAALNRSLIVI